MSFPQYGRLPKILIGLSVRGIWEHVASGETINPLLENVPDEFVARIQQEIDKLQQQYIAIEKHAQVVSYGAKYFLDTREAQVAFILKEPYASIAFLMLDEKDYQKAIWKLLEPKGLQTFLSSVMELS